MPFIARGGTQDIAVAASQTIVIGSFGAGQTKIYTGSGSPNLPPVFALASVLSNGFVSTAYSAATTVRIDASPACEVEYSVGNTPATTAGPAAMLTGVTPTTITGLTAKAGGGQSGAIPLSAGMNRVTVCATGADSAILPASYLGARVSVGNAGAAAMNVFPSLGEQINALGANTAFSVPAGKGCWFECPVVGTWQTILGA